MRKPHEFTPHEAHEATLILLSVKTSEDMARYFHDVLNATLDETLTYVARNTDFDGMAAITTAWQELYPGEVAQSQLSGAERFIRGAKQRGFTLDQAVEGLFASATDLIVNQGTQADVNVKAAAALVREHWESVS